MTRTFLVALDLDPLADLSSFAQEIQESLTSDGYPVTSVHAWTSPSEQLADSSVGQVGLPTELNQNSLF